MVAPPISIIAVRGLSVITSVSCTKLVDLLNRTHVFISIHVGCVSLNPASWSLTQKPQRGAVKTGSDVGLDVYGLKATDPDP